MKITPTETNVRETFEVKHQGKTYEVTVVTDPKKVGRWQQSVVYSARGEAGQWRPIAESVRKEILEELSAQWDSLHKPS